MLYEIQEKWIMENRTFIGWVNNSSAIIAAPTTNKGVAKTKLAKQGFVAITVELALPLGQEGHIPEVLSL